jgi:hypothetical protein
MSIVIESYAFVGVATRATGPTAQVWLPPGFTLTGGGAYDLGRGPANILTSSYPTRNRQGICTGWAAGGRDAGFIDPAPLAVYAIGIRILRDGVPLELEQQVFCASSALACEPGVSVKLGAGWIGTGGGAQDNCANPSNGNMLAASHPLLGPDGAICGWSARGQGQGHDQGRVSAYVIGVRAPEGVTLDARILSQGSIPGAHMGAAVSVPDGDGVVAGGGVLAGAAEEASMLSASCPVISNRDGRLTGWFAARKNQNPAAPSAITAYVVMLEAA